MPDLTRPRAATCLREVRKQTGHGARGVGGARPGRLLLLREWLLPVLVAARDSLTVD